MADSRLKYSKAFLDKCATTQQALLENIKTQYHEQLRSLYQSELNADLIVRIGEDFYKPLHGCILASRVFKFYNTLRLFAINKSVYSIPSELLSPELFKNFTRRIYLDEDVHDEELRLTTKFGDWLRIHRPHLIKNIPKRYSPNHKLTIRTMIPDFDIDESSANSSKIAMSTEPDSIESTTSHSRIDSLDKISNPTNVVSNSHQEHDEQRSTKQSEATINDDAERQRDELELGAHVNSSQDDDRSEYGADISSVDGSNTPTPTSNAQAPPTKDISTNLSTQSQSPLIVPKQRTSTIGSSAVRKSPSQNNETSIKSKNTTNNSTLSSPAYKLSNKAQDYQPVAQKRTNSITKSLLTNRLTSTNKTTQQPINPMVTRAKPISLERAQSPILVEKQSRHQFKSGTTTHSQTRQVTSINHDRKSSNTPQQQTDCESETLGSEISDSSSYAIESPYGVGGYLSIDRHTLASYSRLAEAMTRMFLEEIESDVIINVNGSRQIRAHKCILATRSAYLAEAIEKQHNIQLENSRSEQVIVAVTNDANDNESPAVHRVEEIKPVYINLTDFSYATVHFAVLHLYSGIVKVSDDLELEELAKLTHLLHVGTLRQVCQHNLRMTYCHFFHKPCNICTVGVLKTLPLAWRYDYSELYTKCLQWIGTHFAQIFCLKEFSELRPTDLIEECYAATLNQLQPDNIIQRTLECQKLLKNLPRVKWTESIVGLVGRQLEDFCHYVADHYDKIIQTEAFMSLGKNCWECEILEENLLAAMNHLKPDMGCRCLVLLHKIECSTETFNDDSTSHLSESFANLVCKMRKYCERYLIREAAQVVHCSSWKQMNLSLQRKIKDQALITVDFDDPTRHLSTKPKLTSSINRRTQQHSSQNSGSDTSISKSSQGAGQLPPMKNKKIVSRHVKVLK